MGLLEFFSTPERLKVLDWVLFNPEQGGVRVISRRIGVSPSVVSKSLSFLKKEKILNKKTENPKAQALKIYLNIEKIVNAKIDKLLKKELSPLSAGLYGSWANGTNYNDSDIDIWVKVREKPPEEKELRVRKEIKKRLKVEPSLLILTKKEITTLREKDYPFYCSLVHSIPLRGEGID